jgi:DNA modification methylase
MNKKIMEYSKDVSHRNMKFRGLTLKETPLVYTVTKKEAKKPLQLTLLSNIQFIYELVLARLELHALGADFQVVNNLRTFKVFNEVDEDLLRHRLAYFAKAGDKETEYYHLQKYNLTRSVNQYLTHWIYPYKGKYHPQMIRALLNIIGIKPGETVLDPFIGSGTTAVECEVMGINCLGIDVSPLCVLISKVKTESVDILDEILQYADNIRPNKSGYQKEIFGEREMDDIKDERVKNFYVIAEMIAHSDNSRRGRDFETSFYQNIQKMITSIRDFKKAKEDLGLTLGKVKIEEGDARKLNLENESIDGIITSPPYSIALNYVENDAHSLKALGYDLNKIKDDFIGVRGNGFQKFELYYKDMAKSISEMYRVLKKGRYCVIVIGNVTYQNKEVDTAEKTIRFCQEAGFSFKKKIEKIIYGLYNVMQKEYILIFKK